MNEARLNVFPGSLEYGFASRSDRSPSPVPLPTLLAQARALDAGRCQRLVIAGDSPTRHPQFVDLVRECGRLGLAHLALETDAAPLARRGMTTILQQLGFEQLVIVMGGLSQATQDVVLGERGAIELTMQGIERALRAAAAGGPSVYLVAPVLSVNVGELELLLDWAIELRGRLQGFLLSLPEIDRVPMDSRELLLPYSAQAALAERLFRKCQGHNIEYGFTTKRGVLPCATEGVLERFATVFHDRFQYLRRAASSEQFERVAACGECSLNTSCSGVERSYRERFGAHEMKPVPLAVSMDWKLRRINRLEQYDYRNVSPFENDSPVNPRGLLRINGHCNMSCAFCFVDRTAPDFDSGELEQEIRRMAQAGTRHLVLSGGEPTLHPQLEELIAFARSLASFDVIEMQTNGVKCADLDYTRRLVGAGLNKVTMSLHSIDPAHSDRITRLPNAFGKTVQSIHNFRALEVVTQIAHVITKDNYRELPDTVRFLRREYPAGGGHLSICFAIAQGISDLVFQWVVPTFTEIKPFFRAALDFCLENDIGFGGMIGQGGYPPCMLDGELRYYDNVLDKVFKSKDAAEQFYKSEQCKECSFDSYCLGPRRAYVEHYGDAEIRPFRSVAALAPEYSLPQSPTTEDRA